MMSCAGAGREPVKSRRAGGRVTVYSYQKVNVAAVRGDRGLVIIDTGRSPAAMKEIWKRIAKDFRSNKVLRVINTHGHRDHVSGNQLFPASVIVGQENCPEFMRRTARLAPGGPDEGVVLTPPSRTFADTASFDAGGVVIRMYYAGSAHTNNDLFVHIPSEKVLFAGDLIQRDGRSFGVNRLNDVPRIVGLLDRFVKEGVSVVVPGHGEGFLAAQDLAEAGADLEKEYAGLEKKRSAALALSELLELGQAGDAVSRYCALFKGDDTAAYYLEEEFSLAGRHLLWKGKMDKAIAAFQVAARQFPGSALAYDDLAEAFLRSGNADSAAANYERSLALFPGNKTARKILNDLRR